MPVPARLAAYLMLVAIAAGCTRQAPQVIQEEPDILDPEPFSFASLDAFGFDLDGWNVSEHRVDRNETFSDILRKFGVEYPVVHLVVQNADSVVDLRRLQAGKAYRMYTRDSEESPRALLYQESRVDYVVFELFEPYNVYRAARPVRVSSRQIRGTINGSLYESLRAVDVDPSLAISLSEVFAWQVDFFRIQDGDSFNVVFDERMVGDERIGAGKVRAAYLRNGSADYYAFHYPPEGSAAYFDESGESLRKAFLKAPVSYSRISSRYNPNRLHPVLRRRRAHLGTDYVAPRGTPIQSTGDGVVVEAGFTRGNGNYVKVRHNGTYTTGYLHMSKIATGMRPGRAVKQGETIGYVGSTGLATGDHVCYRFWKNGAQVDPLREEFPSVEPLSGPALAAFMSTRDDYMRRLRFGETPADGSVLAP